MKETSPDSPNRFFQRWNLPLVHQAWRDMLPSDGLTRDTGDTYSWWTTHFCSSRNQTHTIHGIFTHIWWISIVNVGEYTIHGWYGKHCFAVFFFPEDSPKKWFFYQENCIIILCFRKFRNNKKFVVLIFDWLESSWNGQPSSISQFLE